MSWKQEVHPISFQKWSQGLIEWLCALLLWLVGHREYLLTKAHAWVQTVYEANSGKSNFLMIFMELQPCCFLGLGNGIFFPPDLLCSCYSQIFGAWRIEIVYRGRTHFVVVFLYFAQRHPQDLQSSKPVKEVTVVEILYQKAFGKRPQSPTKIKPPKTAYNFSGLLYNRGLASCI